MEEERFPLTLPDEEEESFGGARQRGLSVGDGFKFGCGFMLAVVVGLLTALVLVAIVALIGALLGAPLPTLSWR